MDNYNDLINNKIEKLNKLINKKDESIIDKSIVFLILSSFVTLSTSLATTTILKYIVLLSITSGIVYTNVMNKKKNENKKRSLNIHKDKLNKLLKYEPSIEEKKEIEKKQDIIDKNIDKKIILIDKKIKCALLSVIGGLMGIALSSITPISLISFFISEGLYLTYVKEIVEEYKKYYELDNLYDYNYDKLDIINVLSNNKKLVKEDLHKEKTYTKEQEEYVNKVIKQLEDLDYENTIEKRLSKSKK